MARPSLYTPDLLAEICKRLSRGEPLAHICAARGMPDDDTVRAWGKRDPKVSEAIAQAREAGEERIAADTRKVARGEEGFSTGDVVRDKLVVDTDLKLLAKWNPKKFGDRQMVEHSGQIGVTLTDVTDDELAARMIELLTTGRLKLPAGAQLVEVDEDAQVTDPPSDEDCPW